jgi:hypothetical protein
VLEFDGGEFAGSFYYAGLLSVAYSKDQPALVCFKKGVKSQEQMAKEIAEVIQEVSKKVHVIAIIVDGLLYQIQAVHLFPTAPTTAVSQTNFQFYLSNSNFKLPLPYHLVDLPHVMQLMLTHARDDTTLVLGTYIDAVDALANDLRSKEAVAAIGARCPYYPATRFFYVVLRILFMEKKADLIMEYYNEFL